MLRLDPEKIVKVTYKNHKGETSVRRIIPHSNSIFYGSNEWHKEPQWLLWCWDMDKSADRTFAMKDISSWEPEA